MCNNVQDIQFGTHSIGSTGKDNKCDTAYMWNDIGKTGCTFGCHPKTYWAKEWQGNYNPILPEEQPLYLNSVTASYKPIYLVLENPPQGYNWTFEILERDNGWFNPDDEIRSNLIPTEDDGKLIYKWIVNEEDINKARVPFLDDNNYKFEFYFNATKTIICTDSDGGQDYYKKGNVTGFVGSLITGPLIGYSDTYYDSCEGNTLTELFCNENDYIRHFDYDCPNGCEDGACVPLGYTPLPPLSPLD